MTISAASSLPAHGLPISAVERETGIPKDLLRMWERRYGFPLPGRDEHGDRVYPREQIDKLRLLRRLMDLGFRPGKIVHMETDELDALFARQPARSAPPALVQSDIVRLLRGDDPVAVRDALQMQLAVQGLRTFVTETLARNNEDIGAAWMRGEIEVFEEHLYTEMVSRLLRETLVRLQLPVRPPRVLLTTCPGEQHSLGLLMVEVMLRLAGCDTLSFGADMPFSDIGRAATRLQSQIVALSFSSAYAGEPLEAVQALRPHLPVGTDIWMGGSGCRLPELPEGVQVIRDFATLEGQVAQWRHSHGLDASGGPAAA
ncbi:MerR family transcriptional regulator [Laribacter hongkongensis]|uniref:MerR family transcriptional regulator n=1 Tax=Laribacter hongkongensis TaxID=168471 RepID=UPI000402B244|nr:MerR family transcriptional regulator [Laribacter hongkongensis]